MGIHLCPDKNYWGYKHFKVSLNSEHYEFAALFQEHWMLTYLKLVLSESLNTLIGKWAK